MRVQVPPWALQFTESSAFPAVLLNDSHQPRRSEAIGVFYLHLSFPLFLGTYWTTKLCYQSNESGSALGSNCAA